jgi:hypothetical protein
MVTIKAYTNLEQSKKLAEILPIESADQTWARIAIAGANLDVPEEMQYRHNGDMPFQYYSGIGIPCWSLAALLDVIPQEIFDGEYIINITEGCDNKWIITYDHHENRNHSYYGLSTGADNLVDACTDIIIKLKERNII